MVLLLIIPACVYTVSCDYKISIEDGVMDEGQECFRINLENATLYYQKEAGGFSSILDMEGNDWLGFRQDTIQGYPANAASEYRGLPNLVFRSDDNGAGHPGFVKCHSERIGAHSIRTTSISGKWQWTWTFYPKHAELLVEKIDPKHTYWFLYEGVPGGVYRPQRQYWGTDASGPLTSIPDYYFGNAEFGTWRWVYVGEESIDRVFYIAQVEEDALSDTFSYLGNTTEGVISPDGMVVVGFGRGRDAASLLNRIGQKFIIGFREGGVRSPEEHHILKKELEHML